MSESLADKTILVTRARPQAGVFSAALTKLGAHVIEIPTIEIVPAESAELDTAILSLNRYDWLFFTSANGATIFFEQLKRLVPQGEVTMPKICAIGPATSEKVRLHGHEVSLQPGRYQAEGIIDEFSSLYRSNLSDLKILVPRARVARQVLPEKLREQGADVDVIPVYDTRVPAESDALLDKVLGKIRPDLITFTSSSTVRNFVSLAANRPSLSSYACAVIGPITSQTAKELGLNVVLQPASSTIPDFVRAIEAYLSSSGES